MLIEKDNPLWIILFELFGLSLFLTQFFGCIANIQECQSINQCSNSKNKAEKADTDSSLYDRRDDSHKNGINQKREQERCHVSGMNPSVPLVSSKLAYRKA